jgi:hypothetical protein
MPYSAVGLDSSVDHDNARHTGLLSRLRVDRVTFLTFIGDCSVSLTRSTPSAQGGSGPSRGSSVPGSPRGAAPGND